MQLKTMYILAVCAFCAGMLIFQSCSPKATPETQPEKEEVVEEEQTPEEEVLTNCPTFRSIKNGDEVKQSYVIYRDFLKLNKYKEAFEYWEDVYKKAPAADGKRWNVFTDGIRIYENFMEMSEDDQEKEEFKAIVFRLYDEMVECYPDQKAYSTGRKAFDLYYKYGGSVSDSVLYFMFKEVIDVKGNETPVFVLNPFTALLFNGHLNGSIPMEQAQYYAGLLPEIIDYNLEKGKNLDSWQIVTSFVYPTLERFEAFEGFYPCEYYLDKYGDMVSEVMGNCDEMLTLYVKLRHGDCRDDLPVLVQLFDSLKAQSCIDVSPEYAKTPGGRGMKCLQDGEYQCAVTELAQAAEESEDLDKKANYLMIIAKIYYAHLKDYPASRTFALKAAKVKPNWGAPYILIGKLYASSGALCGPGTGFDSQVVTWVAIDKWKRAKAIDRSVTTEANRLISTYSKYMPDKEDIFVRSLTAGQPFKVECWIQEQTIIRTSD